MFPSLNQMILYPMNLSKNNVIRCVHQYTFLVFVKSAQRHSTSTEQKGVGRQHGKVQEVCSSKKMESKCISVILSLISTHHDFMTL